MKKFIADRKLFIRRLFLIILDALFINLASFLALMIRFDFRISQVPTNYSEAVLSYVFINTLLTIGIFAVFRLYNSLWKYAGIDELTNILFACVTAGAVQLTAMHFFLKIHVPRSFYPLSTLFLLLFVTLGRFFYRYVRRLSRRNFGVVKERIMIIGAGEAGSYIIREITSSVYINGSVVCAIDDDKNKLGSYIQGVKVVGDRTKILEFVEKYEITNIIIAIPSANQKTIRQILEVCKQTNCKLKILPGMYQLINEDISITKLRDVEIDDLLGRDPVKIDMEEVMGYVSGKVILVTGGGGSIGSELCRQLAGHKPKHLIILDIYENNAYSIEQELKNTHPELNLTVLIASVRNTKRIHTIMDRFRPDIIYHAAAHKHVPLMEASPNEAIKNNVGGTYKMAMAAHLFGVKKFILISSDKAVNPTNVMGASKRICELIIQSFQQKSDTEFVAVRFGNVLGSNGSVIPLFKEQILRGGPVTVTHPDIIRYFMIIPEAVSLVLQAGAYAKGGEIFVLDMGEPVRIADLAENLIRLSGYEPGRDIEIEYTGLRPGEKLYEELLMDEEGLTTTANKLIYIGKQIDIDADDFLKKVLELDNAAKEEAEDIRERIMELIPTYHPENAGAEGGSGDAIAMTYVAASRE